MSILIKGLEMPTSCYDCNCFIRDSDGSDYCCLLMLDIVDNGKRDDDCPLVPVQPHGRLIDADTLEVDIRKDAKDPWYEETSPLNWADAFYEFADMVADAPTIIPAEEGE